MDKNLANYVACVAFKSASELIRLLPILKENIPESEYEYFKTAIAKASFEIGNNVLLKIFSEHPDVDADIKRIIDCYGKIP